MKLSNQDILINGLVDFLKEKHKFAFRNRSKKIITFFYGDNLKQLKKYKLPKNDISITLPYKNIINIIKTMINQRPPSDDLQPGEQDPDYKAPTHFKYEVKWNCKEGKEHSTIVLAETVQGATSIICDYYKDFSSHVSTTKVKEQTI
jgi:hypothetical protein